MAPCGAVVLRAQLWVHGRKCGRCLEVANGVANGDRVVANATAPSSSHESRHGKYADVEKRRGYMRQLMRERRARARGGL